MTGCAGRGRGGSDRSLTAGELRRLRPRHRGDRRGPGHQAPPVPHAGRNPRERCDHRLEHVVAVDHRDGGGPAAPGARGRHAFLQPGHAHEAGRGHQRTGNGCGRRGDGLCHGGSLGQEAGLREVHSGFHRQPHCATFLWRGVALVHRRRGRPGDDRRDRARLRRLSDGSVRTDGPDRARRQPGGEHRGVRSDVRRAPLRAIAGAAGTGACRSAGTQERARHLRLPRRRNQAASPRRGGRRAGAARRGRRLARHCDADHHAARGGRRRRRARAGSALRAGLPRAGWRSDRRG